MSINTTATLAEIAVRLKAEARRLGFDLVGIAPAVSPPGLPRFEAWLDAGHHGEMGYLPRRRGAYATPTSVLTTVRSVVMVAMNYCTSDPPEPLPNHGRVSRYAWGSADYHEVLRERLTLLADWLHSEQPSCRTRVVVDTAPFLERDYARLAGLGWFGKNTLLINKQIGSWTFLAGLLTDLELPADEPHETAHCGTCTRCLDVCPTQAFPEPGVLDARRCLSYLNIEHRGLPREDLREQWGEWLFGCDLCQDVCPWNRKAPTSNEPAFQPRAGGAQVDLIRWLSLSDDELTAEVAGTPLDRPGVDGLRRNAALVLRTTGDERSREVLQATANHEAAVVRESALWTIANRPLNDA